jgi:dGTPase
MFSDVASELALTKRSEDSLSFQRHPLAFLVEAADDICYTIIDFEDGINLGLIQEEYALEYLINLVRGKIKTENYNALKTTEDRVSYLRALAIGTLIDEAASLFMKHEEAILAGEFETALLDVSKYKAQIKDIIDISVKNVYKSKEVINKEISGYEILNQLFNAYGKMAFNCFEDNMSNYDKLLLNVLPETVKMTNDSLYQNLMAVCLYVSKLSDTNAMLLHQKLKGNIL